MNCLGALPELVLASGICLLLVYAVCLPQSPFLAQSIGWLGLFLLGIVFHLLVNSFSPGFSCFESSFGTDDFTSFLKILLVLMTAGALLISFDYMGQEKMNSFEFVLLILVSSVGILLVLSASTFITFYLGVELQSLAFYVLASAKRDSEFSTEAGLKYFILGAFSSGILLLGCALIYGVTGLFHFEDLQMLRAEPLSQIGFQLQYEAGAFCVLAGLLFKLSVVPFHMWSPDVYEGSPTAITAFFSLAPKIGILGFFLRFFALWDLRLLSFCIFGSLLVGAFGALGQTKIKRLLAFSSIGHGGYLLLGAQCQSHEGLQALLVYLVLYLCTVLLIFGILLPFQSPRPQFFADLGQYGRENPLLAFFLSLCFFSLAGIPPLAGFFGKYALFFAALDAKFYVLCAVGIVASSISCFYYLRLIQTLGFSQTQTKGLASPIPFTNAFLCVGCAFLLAGFWIWSEPLFDAASRASLSLL